LLIAGTEAHLYVSYDDGESWRPFQLNLPNVPITDVAFQKDMDDLVVATQGRSFYVLDDMPLVRELVSGKLPEEPLHVFAPKPTYRYVGGGGFGGGPGGAAGQNSPAGVAVYYSLAAKPKGDVTITVKDAQGKLVNEYSSKPEPREETSLEDDNPRRQGAAKPGTSVGINRFVWDGRYADATKFPGMIFWAGGVRGPQAVPGTYTVEVAVDGHTQSVKAELKADPRVNSTPEDYRKQLALALDIRDRLTAANQAVIDIRAAKKQLDAYASTSTGKVQEDAKHIADKLTGVEEAIYQTKLRASEDALNFPIKLNNKLAALLGTVTESDTAPTEQSYAVFKELSSALDVQLGQLKEIVNVDVAAFNKLVRDSNVPAISIKTGK
jgi:hypothetical protein